MADEVPGEEHGHQHQAGVLLPPCQPNLRRQDEDHAMAPWSSYFLNSSVILRDLGGVEDEGALHQPRSVETDAQVPEDY